MEGNATNRLRRIAKIWSIISLVLVLLVFIGEIIFPHAGDTGTVPLIDWVLLFLFPFLTMVGLVMAWRWEGWGGGLAVASYVLFLVVISVDRGGLMWEVGLVGAALAAPGLGFLVCARREKAGEGMPGAA
ncbi:MAG: hypothetical protein OEZ02_06550 [Anaerolineae bacterium]|nr:hypothetical protein [Anaerolineae bacterium]